MVLQKIVVIILIISLCACSWSSNSSTKMNLSLSTTPEETTMEEVTSETEVVLPFEEFIDVSFYAEEGTDFSQNVSKYDLVCKYQEEATYAASEVIYIQPIEQQKFVFSCTWARSGSTVYIGLKNSETQEVYAMPCNGGSANGTLYLNVIPEGNYQIVLYSNNNPETQAVLVYQLL